MDNNPNGNQLQEHLVSSEFEAGVNSGFWRIVSFTWPELTVAISAGDGRELGMRIAVDGYPALPPSGQPWDLESNSPLSVERWPTGGTAPQIFRPDWSRANGNAPYMACDRMGLRAHPGWATEHPSRAWNPSRTISFYLREVHKELRGATLPDVQL